MALLLRRRVSKGDMKNLTGVLVSVLEGLATLRPTTRGMEDAGPVEVQVRELTKWFDVGDRVVVDQGENAGCAGTVVGLEGHVVTLVLDGTAREVQAFARHLSRSDKRGGLLVSRVTRVLGPSHEMRRLVSPRNVRPALAVPARPIPPPRLRGARQGHVRGHW